MKKRIDILVIICIIVIFINMENILSESTNIEGGEMVEYSLPRTVFREFIKKPSKELLELDGVKKYVYGKSEYREGYVTRTSIKETTISTDCAESGVMRIGSLPVYTEFVEYVGLKSNIMQFMKENNVHNDVQDYAVISLTTTDIPVSIWVKTSDGNYFITINEIVNYTNPNSTEFSYKLYNHLDFYNKYGIKNGTLKINGVDITDGNYVKFEYMTVYLPVRAIVEGIGGKIEWDDDNKRAIIISESDEYVLRPYEYPSFVSIYNADDKLFPPTGGQLPFCSLIDGRMVVGEEIIEEILEVFNATIQIDYDNLTINIQSVDTEI